MASRINSASYSQAWRAARLCEQVLYWGAWARGEICLRPWMRRNATLCLVSFLCHVAWTCLGGGRDNKTAFLASQANEIDSVRL